MALRPQYSLINSEFNDFLFASVGAEKSGIELTVLSALTRLGFDPWGEAARLSDLPKETAARALAATIAGLPAGEWSVSDTSAIAARLVSHLPGRGARGVEQARGLRPKSEKTKYRTPAWAACIVLAIAALLAMSHFHGDQQSEPAPSPVSAMPR
jgi:hypothetical protein